MQRPARPDAERAGGRMADAAPGAGARAVDAAGVAHDLANVIAVLGGSAAMLEADLGSLPADHPAREQAARIALATARAAELCERLRAVEPRSSHPSRGRRLPATFDLGATVLEACALVAPALPGGCGIDCAIEDAAGDGPCAAGAALDAFQIVLNLATNAAEASGDAAVRVAVDRHVAGREAPLLGRLVPGRSYARLVVEDGGAGLPSNPRALFDRGVTGSGDARRGTGLATVAALVEAAGGAVRAGASDAGGARVEVLWPEAVHRPDLAGARVLIVAGGDPGSCHATARVADALEALGAEPELAIDPLDAVAAAMDEHDPWDAAVVTGGARGLEAADIARRLADAAPHLPLVALATDAVPGARTLPPEASGGTVADALALLLAALVAGTGKAGGQAGDKAGDKAGDAP